MSIGLGIGGSISLINLWLQTKSRLHLLLVPTVSVLPGAAAYLAWNSTSTNPWGVVFTFFLLNSLGLSVLVGWATEFTTKMQRVSMTGDFDVGLPRPSKGLQLLSMYGKLYQELAKSIVVMEGPNPLNKKISEIAKQHPLLSYMRVGINGTFEINWRVIPLFSYPIPGTEGLEMLLDEMLRVNSRYLPGDPGAESGKALRARLGVIVDQYIDLLIEINLLDRLAGGIFSEKALTGLRDFDLGTRGGLPRKSSTLLLGPPSNERENFIRKFAKRGLERGEQCLFVSSIHPPEKIIDSLGPVAKEMVTVVDCYTNRIREIDRIEKNGNIVVTPVELSVVKIAISRAADKDPDRKKRAVVDVLPTYLIFADIQRIYLDLVEIVNDLRSWGYTTVFSANPYVLKEEKKILALKELFDIVLHIERTAEDDDRILASRMFIDIEKMPGVELQERRLLVSRPTSQPTQAQSGEVGVEA